MKTKNSKQGKESKPTVQVKDLKPKEDVKGGITVRKSGKDQYEF